MQKPEARILPLQIHSAGDEIVSCECLGHLDKARNCQEIVTIAVH